MTENIRPQTDHLQPHIKPGGESAHYCDKGFWSKEVSFIHPQLSGCTLPPFANLTTLIEAEARSRFPNFDQMKEKKRKKICQEIAHSAINRPDIQEVAFLEPELLKKLGIFRKISDELNRLLPEDAQFNVPDIEELRNVFVENYPLSSEELKKVLEEKIKEFSWNFDSAKIIDGLLVLQKKLIKIFSSEQIYLRNVKEFTLQTYLDEFGHEIKLSLPISSSKDRTNPHLQNARILKSGGKFLAVTGRPDTEKKALEQAEFLIRNDQAQDGHLYYVVSSYLSAHFDKGMLQNEVEALKNLEGKKIEVDGQSYTLHPILFNTQLSMKAFEPFAPYDLSGKQTSDEIRKANWKPFEDLVQKRSGGNNTLINNAMGKLKSGDLLAEEEILLRAFVCDKLGIASVHHCASSKDRTTLGLAIAGALRKWIQVHKLLGKDPFPSGDPLELWKNEAFKHLVAQELPGCHQLTRNGLGTRGVVHGKELHDDDLGFQLNNNVIARILPSHYLKDTSWLDRTLLFFAAVGAWLLCTTIALLRLIIFPIAIHNRKAAKEAFFNIFRVHRFASLVPAKELDPESPYIKNRHFVYEAGAATPRFLEDLEKAPLKELIKIMRQPNPVITKKEHKEALVLIANNWDRLQKIKVSENLKKLMKLCDESNLTLFKLRRHFTPEFAQQIRNLYPEETINEALQREASREKVQENGIYYQIPKDVSAKRGMNTIIQIVHKDKQITIGQEPPESIMEKLQSLPIASEGEIPIPIQALLTQTAKFNYAGYEIAIKAISEELMLKQRSYPDSWDISIQIIDDNTVQARYRAPFEILQMGVSEPLSALSLDFSITLKRKADGNWVQASTSFDRIRKQFEAKHDFLFTTNQITRSSDAMIQDFQTNEVPRKTASLAKDYLKVLEKDPKVFMPKLITILEHLKRSDLERYNKFVKGEDIIVTTNRRGKITHVKKSNERLQTEFDEEATDKIKEVFSAWLLKPQQTEFALIEALEELSKKLSPEKFSLFLKEKKIIIKSWNERIIYVRKEGDSIPDTIAFDLTPNMDWSLFTLENLNKLKRNSSQMAHSKATQSFDETRNKQETRFLNLLCDARKKHNTIEFYRFLASKKIEVVENDQKQIVEFTIKSS
ncbi:MAG: hypothetical protein JSR58_05170 [Verrucomicrobia bacterium]|nr:hypothetical protein [Verrucomicrobiota bacterium]